MEILHSQILGDGTPFLVLHGFLGMSDNWKTLGMRWAEEGYEVHLLDLRNHGRSFHSSEFSYPVMAEDVKNYCDSHNIDQTVLLGHSMGGKVAMEVAVLYPEMISKLIIADISPREYPPHHQDILKALSSLNFSEITNRQEADDVLANYIPDEGVRMFLLKNLYRKNKNEFALRLNLPVLNDKMGMVGEGLAKDAIFNGDILFIKGEKSGYIQQMDELVIHKHFPNSKIEAVKGAGHWLHADNPEEFYNICKHFLKS